MSRRSSKTGGHPCRCNGAVAMEPLHRRISTASGSERGSINRPIDGTTLATARGTDPAPSYGKNDEKSNDLHADNLFCDRQLPFNLFARPGSGAGGKQRRRGRVARAAAATFDRRGSAYYRAPRRRGRRVADMAEPNGRDQNRPFDAHAR